MAYTLDSLSIEINSTAGSATSGIDALANSLRNLSITVSNSLGNLRELASVLASVKRSANGISFGAGVTGKGSSFSRVASDARDASKAFTELSTSATKAWQTVNESAGGQTNAQWRGFANALEFNTLSTLVRNMGRTFARGVNKSGAIDADGWVSGDYVGLPPVGSPNVRTNTKRPGAFRLNYKPVSGGRRASDMYNWNETTGYNGFPQYSMTGKNNAFGEVKAEAESAKNSMDGFTSSVKGAVGETSSLSAGTKDVSKGLKESEKSAKSLKDSLKGLGKNGPLGLLSQLFRVAKMRVLRSAVMAVAKSFKEGVSNIYQWSDAVGGHFASSMDTASSQLMLMKNSFGSALAPAIEALVPVLTTVVGWIHEACNAIAQFFALLNGSGSWTKATLSAEKYGKATKGAGGATKDLLADWDELNIIQSQGGGGGGGSGATNFADMFEEQFTFDSKIKDFVEWMKEYFDDILITVLAIKTAFGLMSFSKGFEGTLGKVLGLAGRTILLTLGLTLSFLGGEDIGEEGINLTNLAETISGWIITALTSATLAGAIGFSKLAGGGLGLAIAFTVSVAGIFAGMEEENKKKLYGNIKLGAKDIETYVKNSFSAPITSKINIVVDATESVKEAQDNLDIASMTLSENVQKVIIGVKVSTNELESSINNVITAYNNKSSESKTLLEALVKVTPIKDENGIDVSQSVIDDFTGLDTQLSALLQEKGAEIIRLFRKGEAGELSEVDKSLVIQMAKDFSDTFAQAQQEYTKAKFTSGVATTIADMDRETVSATLEETKKQIKERVEEVKAGWQEMYAQAMSSATLAEANGYVDLAEEYRTQANGFLDKMKHSQEQVNEELRNEVAPLWQEALATIFGRSNTNSGIFEGWMETLDPSDSTKLAENVELMLKSIIETTDKPLFDAMEFFGFTGFDILSDNLKDQLFNALQKSFGYEKAFDVFSLFGIDRVSYANSVGWDKFTGNKELFNSLFGGANMKSTIKYMLESGQSLDTVRSMFGDQFFGKGTAYRDMINEIINDPSFKRDIVAYGSDFTFDNRNRNVVTTPEVSPSPEGNIGMGSETASQISAIAVLLNQILATNTQTRDATQTTARKDFSPVISVNPNTSSYGRASKFGVGKYAVIAGTNP